MRRPKLLALALALAAALACAAPALAAAPPPPSPAKARVAKALRARLEEGERLLAGGRRDEARVALRAVVEAYNDGTVGAKDAEGLALVGRAAHLLGRAKDANRAYAEAERAGPPRVETLLWRADLFLDKSDPGHADEVVRDAARLAPGDARVHVAAARVKLDQSLDFAGAERALDRALALDARAPGAWFLRAGLALRAQDLAAADRAVDTGLAASPADHDLLAMRATVRLLAEDREGFERAKGEALARDPHDARFFEIVATYADWAHRYDDIVEMMREATRLDPGDARALALLGENLLRAGDDAGGLDALRRSFALDRFDVRVKNTLDLYEQQIATGYVTVERGAARIRLPRDEAELLGRYVPAFVDEALADMRRRYGFTPDGPIGVELYATREAFSVRTSGLPRVGIEGVCFGRTLAAMSPRAGAANWGNVLWHELSHVFAIQLSKSRVPRWFTEGLSEWETAARRPEWRREGDAELLAALRGGRIPRVADLGRAFTHADDVAQVAVAYHAASELAAYLVEAHGFPKIVAMLRAWGEGLPTEEVFRRVLGQSSDEVDRAFRARLGARLAPWERQFVPDGHAPPLEVARARAAAAPESARPAVELGLALVRAGKLDDASRAVAAALAVDPIDPDALLLDAQLAGARRELPAARAKLSAMVAMGYDGWAVRARLAELAPDKAARAAELERALAFDPASEATLRALVALEGDGASRARLGALAAVDQHDAGAWRAWLARLVAEGAWAEAASAAESALYVDVEGERTHLLAAEAFAHTGQEARARDEREAARLCASAAKPGHPGP